MLLTCILNGAELNTIIFILGLPSAVNMGWIIASVIALFILVVLFLVNFYRDPKRTIPKGNNIVAPCDGTVISIVDTSLKDISIRKGYLGKIKAMTHDISNNCYVISIFMSPLDAHINRTPIAGSIKSVQHTSGTFFNAFDLEKSLSNEKNEIVIQNSNIKIKVIQIAGFLARRIICFVHKNQKVNKGDKIGMIALGSQTTIILPKQVTLNVKLKEHVKAGEKIIACLK